MSPALEPEADRAESNPEREIDPAQEIGQEETCRARELAQVPAIDPGEPNLAPVIAQLQGTGQPPVNGQARDS